MKKTTHFHAILLASAFLTSCVDKPIEPAPVPSPEKEEWTALPASVIHLAYRNIIGAYSDQDDFFLFSPFAFYVVDSSVKAAYQGYMMYPVITVIPWSQRLESNIVSLIL